MVFSLGMMTLVSLRHLLNRRLIYSRRVPLSSNVDDYVFLLRHVKRWVYRYTEREREREREIESRTFRSGLFYSSRLSGMFILENYFRSYFFDHREIRFAVTKG